MMGRQLLEAVVQSAWRCALSYFSFQGDALLSSDRRPPSRPFPEHFTPQQLSFLTRVKTSADHILLRATAGSGKTTTLVEAAWQLGLVRNACYFVYNRHALDGVADRLPGSVKALTLHAYGRGMLCRLSGNTQLTVNDDKSERLAEARELENTAPGAVRQKRRALQAVARLWDLAREHLLDEHASEADLLLLAEEAGWTGEPDVQSIRSILRDMRARSLSDFQSGGPPDFTDFLWLPVVLHLEPNSVGAALVDEAQDLTPLRRAFVLHLTGLTVPAAADHGRLILVGDSDQSIYLYAGAEPGGMKEIAGQIGAQELPLSVSFRCPASHVALARHVSSFIESAPSAVPGVVQHLSEDDLQLTRGDVVLCRTNRPLFSLALKLLRRGVSVNMRGRDLAGRLEAALLSALPGSFTAEQVLPHLQQHHALKLRPIRRLIEEGDRKAKRAAADLGDLTACLEVLCRRTVQLQDGGIATASDVIDLLRTLFHDEADVLLSTVHRAKGLEWERVTLLYPESMPLPGGNTEEEDAVLFVALTRSKALLRLAYGKAAWTGGWRLFGGEDVGDAAHRPEPTTPKAIPDTLTALRQDPELAARFLAAHQRIKAQREAGSVVSSTPSSEAEQQAARLARDRLAQRSPSRATGLSRLPSEVHLHVEDDRSLPLFSGETPIGVVQLRLTLGALAEDLRPRLAEWARQSLALLGEAQTGQVQIDAGCLRRVQRAANLAKASLPLLDRPDGDTLAVRIFEQDCCRTRPARLERYTDTQLDVQVASKMHVFDAATGELLGVPFDPLGMHLKPEKRRSGHPAEEKPFLPVDEALETLPG